MYSHNHNNHDILILPLHTTIHVCVSVKHTPFRYKHQLQRSRVKAQRSTAILCVGRTLVNSSPREPARFVKTLSLVVQHVYLSQQSLLCYLHMLTSYVEA